MLFSVGSLLTLQLSWLLNIMGTVYEISMREYRMQGSRNPAMGQSHISQRCPWTDVNGRKANAESCLVEAGLVLKGMSPFTPKFKCYHQVFCTARTWPLYRIRLDRRFAPTSWFTEVTEYWVSSYKLQGPVF